MKLVQHYRPKPSWFTIEPYEAPTGPGSKFEHEMMLRRDKISEEISHLEKLLKQKKEEFEKANEMISSIREARKFLGESKGSEQSD